MRGVVSMFETPSPKRSRTTSSLPHNSGEGIPAGGGTCAPTTLNICPTKPAGVQFPIAIRPPGLVTRNNSAATSSGRGANIAPYIVTTVSKLASAYGKASASPRSEEHTSELQSLAYLVCRLLLE